MMMNDDLIKRKDVINKILERIDRYTELSYANGSGMKHRRTAMREFLKDLKDIPSADSCEDTISRAFILAELSDLADEFSETDENGLHNDRWCGIMDSKGIAANAPPAMAAKNNGEWISCSERLPEEEGEYLVTVKKYTFDSSYYDVQIAYCSPNKKWFRISNCEIVAWMPRPKPWKEAADED